MIRISLLLLSLGLLSCIHTLPSEREVLSFEKDNIITIQDEISVKNNLNTEMISLFLMAKLGKRPVLFIDSPGGNMLYGVAMTLAIRKVQEELKVPVTCIIIDKAYSMALSIFSECQNRYAMPWASLIWHRPYVVGKEKPNISSNEWKTIMKLAWDTTRSYFDEEYFSKHLNQSTVLTALEIEEVNPEFLTVISNIKITK